VTVTNEIFRAQFPELVSAPDALVDSCIALAANHITTNWGNKADEAHLYYAAHLLATSPYGQAARLSSSEGKSTYGDHYERLQWQVGCGLRYG
jgi:hypothetical protein